MTSDNNLQKKCGFCGENIPAGAGRCPYCASILEVTIDNSYRIEQPEGGQNSASISGRPDAEEQKFGQDTDMKLTASDNQNSGDQGTAESFGTVQPAGRPGQQSEYSEQARKEYKPYGGGGYSPNYNYSSGIKEPLSNGMKVFLTVLFTVVPGVGQLAGIIAAIVFMNTDGDSDRKSFGVALLVASLVMFVISCICCFILVIALSSNQMKYNY